MLLKKKAERTARIVLQLGDIFITFLSFVLAWYMRFQWEIVPLTQDFQPLTDYVYPSIIIGAIWFFVFAWRRMYDLDVNITFGRMIQRLFWSAIVATIIPMTLGFAYRGYSFSRVWLAIGPVLALILTAIWHRAMIVMLRRLIRKGIATSRKLIIGTGEHALDVMNRLSDSPLMAKGIAGFIEVRSEGRMISEKDILGSKEDLTPILIKENIDEVILAEEAMPDKDIHRIIYECRKEQVLFEMVPVFHDLLRGDIAVDRVGSVSMISFNHVAQTQMERVVKRLIDFFGSLFLVILSSPLFLVLAVAIKLESEGPVFFKQKRIGRNGRRFNMIKFRSMFKNADKMKDKLMDQNEADGAMFKIKKDPRVTRIGRFLRKFSLDELPQIYNVLKGDMSLVGPRPTIERELALYEEWQLKRIDTVPGMTGLWQVSGRNDLPFEKMVQLDIYYIDNWSLWLDFKIMFLTIPAVITGRGAY